VTEETISPALSDKDIKKKQQLTGTLLYYARAVDPTLLIVIESFILVAPIHSMKTYLNSQGDSHNT
jgi:hypothetical protein